MKTNKLFFMYGIALVFSVISGAVVSRVLLNQDRSITIRQALSMSHDQQLIELVGDVRPIGENRFVLKDRTGALILSTCPSWYRYISLPNTHDVHAVGMFTTSRDLHGNSKTYFEVFRFRWENGNEMVIRQSWGKPPWAFSASRPVAHP